MPFDTTPSPAPGYATVAEAASRLGITVPRVLRLVHSGELAAAARVGNRWMIPQEEIALRLATGPARGRRYTAGAAWAILFLVAGLDAPWVTRQERWRIRQVLSSSSVLDIRARLSARGRLRRFRVHPGLIAAVRDDPLLMLTGMTAGSELRLGLIGGGDRVDAYIDEPHLADVVARHHLRLSRDANVNLRVVSQIDWQWPPARVAPLAAVALDLLDDPEPRAQQVGAQLLAGVAP